MTEQNGTHTPGEWRSGNELGYGSLNGTQIKSASNDLVLAVAIGDVPELNSKANAAFIVKAVNCHDELVAVLQWAFDRLDVDFRLTKAEQDRTAARIGEVLAKATQS